MVLPVTTNNRIPNRLANEKSPYLLQHAYNPVNWYPWGTEAFEKAKAEDKPIFLSIGYSTCHWCHVMAHESFEDKEIAEVLNCHFVSVKVDREERPDIDNVYMSVCQAFIGSGGWPTSIFMTADQKPFYAGTYFPKISRYGMIGLKDLLLAISEKWTTEREALLHTATEVTTLLGHSSKETREPSEQLLQDAISLYQQSYDVTYGGFGDAPKFPTPHNLLFLMQQYEKHGDHTLMDMVETTLLQMYKGGIFDHIGYGFCRYSTDRFFLVPHFEKMLYDNALLITTYCKAYELTKKAIYMEVAEKTAYFILHNMTSTEGGFYSALDADSDGKEGKYYLFVPDEIISLLGQEDGTAFNQYYGITKEGNFEGESIPNLLRTNCFTDRFDNLLPAVREFRDNRYHLSKDDKVLTAWNALMITALSALYRISKKDEYLHAAKKAQVFIEKELCHDDTLYVSYRDGKHGEKGFLDDYAFYIYALISLYDATLEQDYLQRAHMLLEKTISSFYDKSEGGFYLYGREHEVLIFQPKECYDGAIPSGNSVLAICLVKLNSILSDSKLENILQKQLAFLSKEAQSYPAAYAMFLLALSDTFDPPATLTVVWKDKADLNELPFFIPLSTRVKLLYEQSDEYKLLNDRTTYYLCQNHSCLPPVNDINEVPF